MNNLFRLPENTSPQARYAFRTGLIMVIASALMDPFYFYLAYQSGTWQLYTFAISIVVFALLMLVAAMVARRGQSSLSAFLILGGLFAIIVLMAGLITGLGLVLAVGGILIAAFIGAQMLPPKSTTLVIVASVAVGSLVLFIDLFDLVPNRLSVPVLDTVIPIVAGGFIVIFGVTIVRQFRDYSLRTKLIVSFVAVALVSVSGIVYFSERSSEAALTDTIGNNLSVISAGQASQVGQVLATELDKLNTLAISDAVQQRAAAGTATDTLTQAQINALDQEWRNADAANNNFDPLVARVLSDPLSAELLKFRAQYPENVEVFLTDLPGVSIATTDRTSDYLQSDEDWWQAAYKNGQYIGQPAFDASAKTLAINMAVAVRAPHGNQIVGVLRTTVNINSLADVLGLGLFGKAGQTSIYLPDGQQIKLLPSSNGKYELNVENAPSDFKTILTNGQKYQLASIDNVPNLVSTARVSDPSSIAGTSLIKDLGWYTVTYEDQTDALAPATTQAKNNLILAVVIAILAVVAAIVLAQFLAGPLLRLNSVAEIVAAGDLTVQAKVESRDETGTLATTFNKMVSQLNGLIGTLEQRVEERTKAMETVADVSIATSTILESKRLLQEVVDLTKERFNLYHSHIYLMDEEGKNLVLAAGAGEPGRTMVQEGRSIPLGREQSLVARAARDRKGVTVNDVTQAPDFLPNPLLPDTRSELAVPMIGGGNLIGVFDIQSDQAGRFTDSDVSVQTTLAAQLATSIQNVRTFEESKARADLESQVNAIGQKIQRAATVEETLQTAIRELGTAIGASRVKVKIQAASQAVSIEPVSAD